jgi:hypothetical protein
MKTLNLTKTALVMAVATQLLASTAGASTKMGFKETLFTSKKEAIQDPYYQIKSAKVTELTDEEAMEFINETPKTLNETKGTNIPNIPPKPPEAKGNGGLVAATGGGTTETPTPSPSGFFDGVIMIVDKLIAIGQKVIPTIEKGKAVVTNNPMAAVSVLPRLDTKDPVLHDMGGWSIPMTKHYKITYSNGLGSDVVSFVYSITYQYGGEHEGKGKYLTGIRASARNITISWGFDLDASSRLIAISNVGTPANVVAGATIEMSYTVKNWTRTLTTNTSFFVAGDGRLYRLD